MKKWAADRGRFHKSGWSCWFPVSAFHMDVTSKAYVGLQAVLIIAGGHVLNLKNWLSGGILCTLELSIHKHFAESNLQCSVRNSAEDNDKLLLHCSLSKLRKGIVYLTWPFPNLHTITVIHFLSVYLVKIS